MRYMGDFKENMGQNMGNMEIYGIYWTMLEKYGKYGIILGKDEKKYGKYETFLVKFGTKYGKYGISLGKYGTKYGIYGNMGQFQENMGQYMGY